MSAYLTLVTPMTDEECLVAAIAEEGFAVENIFRSATPVTLRGWQKGQEAHIVLRREHTGDAYNDIGFLRTALGYTATISNDHARFGPEWLARVGVQYRKLWQAKQERLETEERRRLEEERRQLVEAQRQAVHERARKMGYHVKETREGESIRLVLVRRTY